MANFLDSTMGTLRGYVLFSTGSDSQTVIAVQAGGPAAAAGLRPGDRIDLDALYPIRKTNYDPIILFHRMPGQSMTLPFVRGGRRMVAKLTLAASHDRALDVFQAIAELTNLALLVVGAWIVLARPSLMTWSFYAFLAGIGWSSSLAFSGLGYWPVFASAVLGQMLGAMFVFIIVFAARVPNDRATGWRYWLQFSAIPLYVIWAGVGLYPIVAWSLLGVPARYAILPVSVGNIISVALLAAVAFAFVLTYFSTRGSDRVRMGWVLRGGLLWVTAALIFSIVPIPFSGYGEWLNAALTLVLTIGIVMVAYGVVTSRIIDAAFFVSRTIVVGAIAGGIVVAFAVLDWLVTKKLEASRLGMAAEVGLAIALGFWLNGLHNRVDHIVDRLFFRKRYAAEQRLARAAHAVVHAHSINTIREFLVDEPHSALDLASAALFEQPKPESNWKRTKSIGWESHNLAEMDAGDPLVLHIEAEQATLRASHIRWPVEGVPHGRARPVIAVPVIARRRVIAIALYGEHAGGADLDADEIGAIENLAEAAGAAYDHVEATELRSQLAAMSHELDMLRLGGPVTASD
ncbi:MAG TPA: hypothetical protein VGZ02_08165 [Candidatus Baltobacteraceae bacterium]|nr:hypothetical protein [Candidatus Baltobacteraceae bacterium]